MQVSGAWSREPDRSFKRSSGGVFLEESGLQLFVVRVLVIEQANGGANNFDAGAIDVCIVEG